jgi:predicted nucleotidyltransferase component of viral defense system
MLNNKHLREVIIATRQHLNLREAVIEKDYYVTQVIHALSGIENSYFQLVFCGGTCLAKAHKIVHRMSEDVDFKVQLKKTNENFSKTRLLKELKDFRSHIKSKLTLPGLTANEPIVRNEGQYSRIELNYISAFPASAALRPHILLEFTLSNIHLAIDNLSVKTIIEDYLKNIIIFEPCFTKCVSVDETFIEKWVGLTRRIIAIERAYHHDDKALIRHVYDLNAIRNAGRINTDFLNLAKIIINNDAKQFKNQHPEYAINPSDEVKRSIDLLKNNPIWEARYQEFIEEMVYDATGVLEYKKAIAEIEQMSLLIISNLLGVLPQDPL